MTLVKAGPSRPAFDTSSTKAATTDPTIVCPKCKTPIPITEALAGPLLAAKTADYERQIESLYNSHKRAEVELEQALRSRLAGEAREAANLEVEAKIKAAQQSAAAAQELIVAAEHREAELRTKLTVAQQAQAEALRKERQLDEDRRELNLTIERRVSAEAATLRAHALVEADEKYKLQIMQSDLQAKELREQIDELKRKATETSQRVQGEVQELDLEATLRGAFPFDVVTEVAKGVNGADRSQLVRSHTGSDCGTILYESKRTKNWSPGWLPKLREDMRNAKAHIAVLVTQAMPSDVEGFDCIDSIWVAQPKFVQPLAMALRETLLRAHNAAQAAQGMRTQAELVYQYMTGHMFRSRVEAIVESFTTMQADLEAEKRATLRVWAKREAQITRTIEATAGMFGDLQGISGKALPEIAGLALLGGEE